VVGGTNRRITLAYDGVSVGGHQRDGHHRANPWRRHGARWDPRIEAEFDRFAALGWDAWLAEGQDLPPLAGWPTDEAAFYREVHERMARDAADAQAYLIRLGWRRA
jgi:hypothetical protein